MKAKRLKPATLKRYNAEQLRQHLARLLQDQDSETSQYRIRKDCILKLHKFYCGPTVYKMGHFKYCDLSDRAKIADAISDVYHHTKLGV